MKKAITMIGAVLSLFAAAATNTTVAAQRHGQVYYVNGHHPFVIQPTIGPDGKATLNHPEVSLALLKQLAEKRNNPEAMFQLAAGCLNLDGCGYDDGKHRVPSGKER